MTSKELRQKYIDFFQKKGHSEVPSASLIPENDSSTLFISAGMQPIVSFLLGEKHPLGNKLANCQKCIRTIDIDEVGDRYHHTFFEMLGHWSLGSYFKQEAIEMSYEFLTQELKLEPKRLAFTVFVGDKNAPKDEESFNVWKSLGVQESKIAYLSKTENWWEPTGSGGPCGPCTEMFYWSNKSADVPEKFDHEDKRWVEIGNDVLMQYEKIKENGYQIAKQKNIDNGTGLERLLTVINGLDDNYLTDLFLPIINKIEKLSGKKYSFTLSQLGFEAMPECWENEIRSIRIIADHLRAATFIMGDDLGIAPSNVDQGYVVRKLIRRAIRHGRMIGIKENFTHKIGQVVIDLIKDVYPELEKNRKFALDNFQIEEEKFTKCLQQGLKEFDKLVSKYQNIQCQSVNGVDVFNLFQTYGFPLELTIELAKEKGLEIDEKGFNKEMKKHQELSRTASAGKFKGGLADQSEQIIKYHTATHLLLAGLRQLLGPHVFQKGSNITDERLRFDFSHSQKLTEEQIVKVEKMVNNWIQQDLPVSHEEMSLEQAKQKNAMGIFENKYDSKVKVYKIGDKKIVSFEICGGPHVKRTGLLGKFKIKKEESSSSGVRRIKAVLKS